MQQDSRAEKIGSVTLDLSLYPGQDFYSDGDVEDRILDIVRSCPADRFEEIIRERKDWPTLYHLSPIRGNIVDWIPFDGSEKVLEIGAGPGAITGTLLKSVREVTCVELSYRRSLINAARHKDADNLLIRVGNFEDIEPTLDTDYDYIFLIGVLEYARQYIHSASSGDPFREELLRIRKHLSSRGRLVIAIENRLGLKYFAGCREDHSGRFFDGIESYDRSDPAAVTFSKPALEKLLRSCGIQQFSFYYPYPDYKFPSKIYSDERLPAAPELNENIRNFDRDRLLLFDERKAYRGITQDGLYPVFANSFEIVTGPALPVEYCKFSNDRDARYAIRTSMERNGEERFIVKTPQTKQAQEHVDHMIRAAGLLSKRYADGALRIASCTGFTHKDGTRSVRFPLVAGTPLEDLLDERLSAKDREGFLKLLAQYRAIVGFGEEQPAADYDMTFANLLIEGDTWTAIDYEWTAERAIPAREMLYRSLACYFREDPERRCEAERLIPETELLSFIGVSGEEAKRLTAEEDAFQKRVTGDRSALGELRAEIGGDVIRPGILQTPEEIAAVKAARKAAGEQGRKEDRPLASVQVYVDTGSGFREEQAWFVEESYGDEGVICFTIPLTGNEHAVRVDPALCPCVALLRKAELLDDADSAQDITHLVYRTMKTNGAGTAGSGIVYATDDPWMCLPLPKVLRKAGRKTGQANALRLTLQMAGLPSTMAQMIRGETN